MMLFSSVYEPNGSMKIIGSFWIAIGIVSVLGLFNPVRISPILIIQIIYKGLYLCAEVVPRMIRGQIVPIQMSIFFLVWVLVLPFFVPWKLLLTKTEKYKSQ